MEILASTLVWAGLAAPFFGFANLIRPLRPLGVERRRTGVLAMAGGLVLVLAGMALPPRPHRATRSTHLDAFFPAWEFAEVHSIHVSAPPGRVYRAIREVTADEIRLFRILTWIRNPGRTLAPQPPSVLAPPAEQPILDVATRSGFVWLADVPVREVLVGAVVCCRPARPASAAAFAALQQPGFAKAGMNFLLEDDGDGGTRVTTETRVHGTDPWTQRRFAAYWRVIYPGSALIRRGWLRAVKKRAESTP